ncbi:MAG: tRNA pseudouridine(55) synthase TruB [Rhizobiaceae bacterium]|nr:tRNA pseudouridine(55) synthase TruB [Rhizobiaceae bacterium]
MGRNKKGRAVSGWLVLDKPYELGSTQAVGKIRWLFQARKAGHAGTLDPLATGILPIALGEATKTVPYVTDGEKAYRFTVQWGRQTNTDDAEGTTVNSSDARPTAAAIEALLPQFRGEIQQTPPAFSAIKIDGKRAYAQARAGEHVELQPRAVSVESFDLVACPDEDHAIFEVVCGKGTYIRAFARDLGLQLKCFGHVRDLRRTFVEPFEESDAVRLDDLLALEGDIAALDDLLVSPIESMQGFPEIRLTEEEARRVRLGNSIILRGRDAPIEDDDVCAVHRGQLIAIGDVAKGEFQPRRVLAA